MLAALRVKNIALVQDIRIEFEPGLNVITGETGAGKSILVGALGLLLGERADKTLIRTGETSCMAEAMFELQDPGEVARILESLGLDPGEDGSLVIRRVVKASGAGQNFVNDSPVTLQALKQLGEVLVDMHGPHDHQSLLHVEEQLNILDAFGHLQPERDGYLEHYRAFKELESQRAALEDVDGDVEAQIDLLSYQVKEIEEADLKEYEEDEVRREHALVGNAQRVLELTGQVVDALTENEISALDQLAAGQRALGELARLLPEAEEWGKDLQSLASQVQDVGASVSRVACDIDADPSRLEWLDQRLAIYDRMKRKYGGSVESALEQLDRARRRLNDLQSREQRLAEVEQAMAQARGTLQETGEILRKKRGKVASRLAEAITRELKVLGFPHGSFSVELQAIEPIASGLDAVEFGFAPNVGEPSRPLRAIASSGEISRVMLATKAVLAQHDRIPLLVFDEVDANVGGEMGSAIGRKLLDATTGHQVICITHLPQVAIHGNAHYAVRKEVEDGRTYTRVEMLNEEARVEEVARMLGGRDFTSVTLEHAREMLDHG